MYLMNFLPSMMVALNEYYRVSAMSTLEWNWLYGSFHYS